MPVNSAAWLVAKHARLEVKPAPYTPPREDEIVVKNHALAINPVDWIKPLIGDFMFSWIKYPFVLGSDLAGEVVEVGPGVSRFKIGDRVVANAVGMDPTRNNAAEGAFQAYTVVPAHMASPIPDAMTYESAAVMPLGLSTAACGLFQKDHLALRYPSASPRPTGQSLLIWGGATSVGSNAIQLAVAAGYDVFTTCSPGNFDYVRKLGASRAFDYKSPTVVKDLIKAFEGKTSAGALAIGATSAQACLDVVHGCRGAKFVSMASFPISFDAMPAQALSLMSFLAIAPKFLGFSASMWIKSRLRRIRTNFIFGSTLLNNEVGPMIYVDFLPKALAEGRFVAAPDPLVVGQGLESVQVAFDIQRKGVSAKKVVVSL